MDSDSIEDITKSRDVYFKDKNIFPYLPSNSSSSISMWSRINILNLPGSYVVQSRGQTTGHVSCEYEHVTIWRCSNNLSKSVVVMFLRSDVDQRKVKIIKIIQKNSCIQIFFFQLWGDSLEIQNLIFPIPSELLPSLQFRNPLINHQDRDYK